MSLARVTEWFRDDGCVVSNDPDRVDVALVARFLAEESYWALGRPRDVVETSLATSVPFGVYDASGAQLGFARVVTDLVTFGWLCDVFVVEPARGRGLGGWLVGCVLAHPDLRGLRRWVLATRDAHGLYAKHGFSRVPGQDRWMVREDSSSAPRS